MLSVRSGKMQLYDKTPVQNFLLLKSNELAAQKDLCFGHFAVPEHQHMNENAKKKRGGNFLVCGATLSTNDPSSENMHETPITEIEEETTLS